jgi:hypothetical protein
VLVWFIKEHGPFWGTGTALQKVLVAMHRRNNVSMLTQSLRRQVSGSVEIRTMLSRKDDGSVSLTVYLQCAVNLVAKCVWPGAGVVGGS